MLDQFSYVAEANRANIMMVKEGKTFTPYAMSALEGVTRGLLLRLLPENGVPALEKNLTL